MRTDILKLPKHLTTELQKRQYKIEEKESPYPPTHILTCKDDKENVYKVSAWGASKAEARRNFERRMDSRLTVVELENNPDYLEYIKQFQGGPESVERRIKDY